ncbi:MAG: hypothetical protein LBB78_00405 [Spirochaetaceae bacterium]|nr:hypothetical protein [Spirochaetaceae bacterium]
MKNSEEIVLSDPPSFDDLLDKTCERLWNKKKQYTLRRLRELDHNLNILEQELEQIVFDSGMDRAERVR